MTRTPEQLVQNARDNRRFVRSTGTEMLGDYLDAIFQTLDERLPEKPMKVIVPATAPVEDSKVPNSRFRPQETPDETFHCKVNSKDFVGVESFDLDQPPRTVYITMAAETDDPTIVLTPDKARAFAKSILRAIGDPVT